MPTMRPRTRARQPSLCIQTREELLARQWSYGLELGLRALDPDGCTDLADDVRAVVGAWRVAAGWAGPVPLVSARLALRMALAQQLGTRTVLQTQSADELLLAALCTVNSGLTILPLRKRLTA